MAYYTVKGWTNQGPQRLSDPMNAAEALRAAGRLRDEGCTHVTLTDVDTGVETELERFPNAA
jgi:hypothetical protein